MKKVLIALLFFAVSQVVFVSCRDAKKDIETEGTTSAVEEISKEAVKTSKEIEVAVQAATKKVEKAVDTSLEKVEKAENIVKEDTKETSIDAKQTS